MMKIEYWFRSHQEIHTVDFIQADIVGIGDEGCVHKFEDAINCKDMAKKIINKGKNIRWITPKVAEKNIARIVEQIAWINEVFGSILLTVNDFGVLFALTKHDILPTEVTIGRGISRAFEDCLWWDHILRKEDEMIRQAILQNNMAHKLKIDFLKRFNVTGIECNQLENQASAFRNISGAGWKISMHYDFIAMAFSRACQTAKYFNDLIPECTDRCNKKLKIEMDEIWTRNGMAPVEKSVSENLKALKPTFFLQGNMLLRKSGRGLNSEVSQYLDTVILHHNQFKDVDHATRVINKIRDGDYAKSKN